MYANQTEKLKNPQVRRSKEWLRTAIIELMKEKPLNDISINELVKKADLSRSAFYNHYESKTDILYEYAVELYLQYVDSILNGDTSTQLQNWKLLLSHYLDWRDFYILIYQNGLSYILYDVQIKNSNRMMAAIEKTLGFQIVDKELYYNVFVPYHRRAEIELTLQWLANGAKESVDEMAQLFASLSSIAAYEHFRVLYYA